MDKEWDFGLVTMSLDQGICWVRFNRPERMNVLSSEMLESFHEALTICEDEGAIRVVVVTGNDRAFVAGNDVRRMANEGVVEGGNTTKTVARAQEKLANLPKPTIAAIAGYALGAGLEIALCCDFRVAAENATLGLPEITLGVIPGGGGTQRLPRLVGSAVANRMIMLGDRLTAAEAERVGLVDQVVPVDSLADQADALAHRLAEAPPLALSAAKTAMRAGIDMSLGDGLKLESALFSALFGTEDKREGMAAFLEKRKPTFEGR